MPQLTPEVVKYLMLSFLWFQYLWELLLDTLQCRKCKTASIPAELTKAISKEVFEKSRSYALDRLKLGLAARTFFVSLNTGILLGGLIAISWTFAESISPDKSTMSVSCLWVFLVGTAYTLVKLPFVIYFIFGQEKKYGFNKQTVGFFIADQLKEYFVYTICEIAFTATSVGLFEWLGDWFFLALLGISLVVLLLLIIAQQLIESMFDTFTLLPEGALKSDIEALAASVKFPLSKICLVEGSKRSGHSNAYVSGICCSNSIVLYDTLLPNADGGGYQNDEIVAILAHELGHWYHHHMAHLGALMELKAGVICAMFYLVVHVSQIYEAVGFGPGRKPLMPGLVIILLYILPLFSFLGCVPENCYVRHLENQADSFAKKMQKQDALKRALINVERDNLIFSANNKLYSVWYYNHPDLLERLKNLD